MRKGLIAFIILGITLYIIMLTTNMEQSNQWMMFEYIVKNGFSETQSENLVTAIYLNYRFYDTIFEALLLIISVIAVIYLSVHKEHYHE